MSSCKTYLTHINVLAPPRAKTKLARLNHAHRHRSAVCWRRLRSRGDLHYICSLASSTVGLKPPSESGPRRGSAENLVLGSSNFSLNRDGALRLRLSLGSGRHAHCSRVWSADERANIHCQPREAQGRVASCGADARGHFQPARQAVLPSLPGARLRRESSHECAHLARACEGMELSGKACKLVQGGGVGVPGQPEWP